MKTITYKRSRLGLALANEATFLSFLASHKPNHFVGQKLSRDFSPIATFLASATGLVPGKDFTVIIGQPQIHKPEQVGEVIIWKTSNGLKSLGDNLRLPGWALQIANLDTKYPYTNVTKSRLTRLLNEHKILVK